MLFYRVLCDDFRERLFDEVTHHDFMSFDDK